MTTDTAPRQPKGIPVGGQFAANTHAEPELILTAPKVTSRGRTTNVTLPDGTVATRTSKTKEYSHAVVLGPEDPEKVIAGCERSIKESKSFIAAREEALKDPKFAKRQRFRDDRNPDADHSGKPVYYGFEYFLKSADGKERLEEIRGNSEGISDGSYIPETLEYVSGRKERSVIALKAQTAAHIKQRQEYIAEAESRIESVKNGTYNLGGYGVVSWASRPDLADKAANTYANWSRPVSVVPVDQ